MPNWTKLVMGWAIAATVALAFSWGAVAQVRNRVIQPSVEIPTTLARTATQPPAETTTTLSGPTTTSATPATTSTTLAEQVAESPAPTTTQPVTTQPTTAPPTTVSTTTTSTQPPTTTTTTLPPPETTTTTTVPPPQTASYTLEGGVVTISYSPGLVSFVTAIPQPGYSADPRETGPTRVRVRFESEDHTSDFRAEWEGGELSITENESDDS